MPRDRGFWPSLSTSTSEGGSKVSREYGARKSGRKAAVCEWPSVAFRENQEGRDRFADRLTLHSFAFAIRDFWLYNCPFAAKDELETPAVPKSRRFGAKVQEGTATIPTRRDFAGVLAPAETLKIPHPRQTARFPRGGRRRTRSDPDDTDPRSREGMGAEIALLVFGTAVRTARRDDGEIH
jgi:hypothetical protein